MFALVRFTAEYCQPAAKKRKVPLFIDLLLAVDVVQYALNPLFGQAFELEEIEFDGSAYYRLVPHIGQTFLKEIKNYLGIPLEDEV